MEYVLEQGKASNVKITLTVTADDMTSYKKKALENFQKDMKEPGFREGHVPLDIVEKKVNPAYVEMWVLEEVVHAGTKQVIEEHNEKKFIGNIYDLNREEKDGNTMISFYLDVYPEVVENNKNWEKETIDKIEDTPTPEEIEDTLTNLRKQYADYKQVDVINENCVFKVKFVMQDKDGNEVDTWSVYLWKEEMTEFPIIKTLFAGKKDKEEFTTDYNEKDFPPMLHNRNKDGKKATKVVCTISDVREVVLPDFSAENIKKFFGNDDVTTEEQLREKITELIAKQKREMLLMQAVDGMLNKAASSFTIIVPKTLVEEEKKTRMKSLEERMGGADGMKQYFEKIGEEEGKKMHTEIETAAKQSLEKFFLLKEIVEKLGIESPDWKTPMDVENKVYEKMMK